MLSIAITRHLKENIKPLLVICTEHETQGKGKQKPTQLLFGKVYFLLGTVYLNNSWFQYSNNPKLLTPRNKQRTIRVILGELHSGRQGSCKRTGGHSRHRTDTKLPA